MSQNKPIVLSTENWNTSSIKYMAPKVNDRGGKSINIISTQTNRTLHIETPLLMTWGVSDFVDAQTGESDGKFSLSLNFPNAEYSTKKTNEFLQKLKDYESQILDDAVKNSNLWWGEEMSREVAKHTFFPFLKYSKNKDTKKIDLSKPPSIRAKVPYYNGKWAVEIYDTKSNMIFPCENDNHTPVDFIPKMSSVACVLQCGGIWIGGKGWGLTWKLVQCVVKPREVISVYGKCQIQLSSEERDLLDKQEIKEDVTEQDVEDLPSPPLQVAKQVVNTKVEDSDEEAEVEVPVEKPVKKIIKKDTFDICPPPPVQEVTPKQTPVVEPTEVPETNEPVVAKKKIVKKTVVK
jgi:hypothetical protein